MKGSLSGTGFQPVITGRRPVPLFLFLLVPKLLLGMHLFAKLLLGILSEKPWCVNPPDVNFPLPPTGAQGPEEK
jgi:hypothetical protein